MRDNTRRCLVKVTIIFTGIYISYLIIRPLAREEVFQTLCIAKGRIWPGLRRMEEVQTLEEALIFTAPFVNAPGMAAKHGLSLGTWSRL